MGARRVLGTRRRAKETLEGSEAQAAPCGEKCGVTSKGQGGDGGCTNAEALGRTLGEWVPLKSLRGNRRGKEDKPTHSVISSQEEHGKKDR